MLINQVAVASNNNSAGCKVNNQTNTARLIVVGIHGAYGYSDEYPVERYLRNSKAPVIYEGTREIHTVMQGEYALGYREDKPLRKQLPSWPFEKVTVR